MRKKFRRFEILLPTRFNDGRVVPDELLAETLLEIRKEFHAVSTESQIIQGQWEHAGRVYEDENVRLFVDVPDSEESIRFFERLKETLKQRYQQLDVWITTYPLEVL